MPINQERANAWKALNPQQREQALARMSPEQKTALAGDLGYREKPSNVGTLTAPPDDRNGFQRSVDNLSTVLPGDRRGNSPTFNAAQDFGAGVIGATAGVAAHPVRTLKSLMPETKENGLPTAKGWGEMILGPAGPMVVNAAEGAYNTLKDQPLREAIPSIAGQLVGGELMGEAGSAATRGLTRAAGESTSGVARALTKTTAKDTGKLVSDVARGNEAAIGKANEANAKAAEEHLGKSQEAVKSAEDKRKVDLRKHFEKRNEAIGNRQGVEEKVGTAVENQGRVAPAKDKLDNAWSNLRAKVETARNNALKEGHTKYNTVNEKLNPIPADMEKVHELYGEASNVLGETQVQPPILKRIGTALEKGEQLSYKDLQGAYSELGKELSKGTLPGATYHAYDVLQEGIGADMQRIADSQGAGPQLTDARNYWRRMKQTFGKPLRVTDAAGKALNGSASDVAGADARANQLRLLGSFDPTIPQQFSHVANIEGGLEHLPAPKSTRDIVEKAKPNPIPARKPILPKVQDVATAAAPDRPVPVAAETRTLTPSQLTQSKANAVLDSVNNVSRSGHTPTTTATILHAAKRMTVGKILEIPEVVNYLSTITPADVAQVMRLPEDQRAGFENVVKAARAKGVKISPALGAVIGLQPRKGVAAALQP